MEAIKRGGPFCSDKRPSKEKRNPILQFRIPLGRRGVTYMGVDSYQTYQTSRTTFSTTLSAAPVTVRARDTALSLGQASTKYPSRCHPKKNQIIPTIRYRPSVKCRPFTGCRTLLSAAPRLIAQYDQYYHRLVPGGNVFSHNSYVPPLYRVPPLH